MATPLVTNIINSQTKINIRVFYNKNKSIVYYKFLFMQIYVLHNNVILCNTYSSHNFFYNCLINLFNSTGRKGFELLKNILHLHILKFTKSQIFTSPMFLHPHLVWQGVELIKDNFFTVPILLIFFKSPFYIISLLRVWWITKYGFAYIVVGRVICRHRRDKIFN